MVDFVLANFVTTHFGPFQFPPPRRGGGAPLVHLHERRWPSPLALLRGRPVGARGPQGRPLRRRRRRLEWLRLPLSHPLRDREEAHANPPPTRFLFEPHPLGGGHGCPKKSPKFENIFIIFYPIYLADGPTNPHPPPLHSGSPALKKKSCPPNPSVI